jgi:hypothetical protein
MVACRHVDGHAGEAMKEGRPFSEKLVAVAIILALVVAFVVPVLLGLW